MSFLTNTLFVKQILQEFRERLKIPQTVLDQCDANPCASKVQHLCQLSRTYKPYPVFAKEALNTPTPPLCKAFIAHPGVGGKDKAQQSISHHFSPT